MPDRTSRLGVDSRTVTGNVVAAPVEATPTSVTTPSKFVPGKASKVTATGSPSRIWAINTSGIATSTSGREPEVSSTTGCP